MFKNEDILKQLNWRYAVKRFDASKKISSDDWDLLEQSLLLTPSSYGIQPWKFLIVQDSELRKKLCEASWNQSQVKDCSHYVVFTTRSEILEQDIQRHIERIAEVRGVSHEALAGFKKGMLSDLVHGPRSQVIKWWSHRQAYIAMGFLMETAALLSIDTCPLEGLDPLSYDKILNLEGTDYLSVAAVALGYRHADDKTQNNKKVRFDKKEVIQYL
ncbi:MAG: NAD(P)H-dependent oxidoreductase [Bdellovibrionota bacterium]